MKNILSILFVLFVGCSNSTDSGNLVSTNPDLEGLWDVHYYGNEMIIIQSESFKVSETQIMFQGRWYDCSYNGKSVSWDATTAPGSDYGYDIRMTSKDRVYGSSYLDDANGNRKRLTMVGIEI